MRQAVDAYTCHDILDQCSIREIYHINSEPIARRDGLVTQSTHLMVMMISFDLSFGKNSHTSYLYTKRRDNCV